MEGGKKENIFSLKDSWLLLFLVKKKQFKEEKREGRLVYRTTVWCLGSKTAQGEVVRDIPGNCTTCGGSL